MTPSQPNPRRDTLVQGGAAAAATGQRLEAECEPSSDAQWESDEEISQASGLLRDPTRKQAEPTVETVPYRPLHRAPLAMVCVLDDGQQEGEWVRVRAARFVIGRADGDLIIGNDLLMSSRHAELTQVADEGRFRWFLTDLGSTNGTFVRVRQAVLRPGQELMFGAGHYRFEAAAAGPDRANANAATQGWQHPSAGGAVPALVEVTPQGEGQRFFLTRPDNWIGRDPRQCHVALEGDSMVNPRHARIFRDAAGRWLVENNQSVNGTWIRTDRTLIDKTGQFQLGEQRFLIKIL